MKPCNPAGVIRETGRLSRTAMYVYGELVFWCGMAMVSNRNPKGYTHHDRESMAAQLGISLSTLHRALKELRAEGLVFVRRMGTVKGRQGQKAQTWLCLTPELEQAGFREFGLKCQPDMADVAPVPLPPTDLSPIYREKNPPPNTGKESKKDLSATADTSGVVAGTKPPQQQPKIENLISDEQLEAINAELEAAHLQPFTHRGDEVLRRMVQQAGSRVDLLPRWIFFETQRPRQERVWSMGYFKYPDVLKRMDRWLNEPTDPPKPRQKYTCYPGPSAPTPNQAPFTIDEVREFLTGALDQTPEPIRKKLTSILNDLPAHYAEFGALQDQLSKLEDDMIAMARTQQSEADLAEARAKLDSQLKIYRGKMSTPQLMLLEKQFLDRWLLEKQSLPRLSLFYLH